MILAQVDWLSISINLLLIVFVITALLMSLLIMMQRPKQEGLGAAFGSGMTDQVFGARTTSVLQKGTVYLATLFFILTLTLAILFARKNQNAATMVADAPPPVSAVTEEPIEAEEPEPTPSLAEELEEVTGGEDASDEPEAEGIAPAVEVEETPEASGGTETQAPAEEETPAAEDETPETQPAE